jgi:phosphatidylglycerophosphatase A
VVHHQVQVRLVKRRLVLLFATGFGTGLSPVASGTVGSLPGVLLAAALCGLPPVGQAFAAAALAALAFPICDAAERIYKTKDDKRIVADEYLTFPLCLVGLPWWEHAWLLPAAFVVCRAMDVLKPFPAYRSQQLKGGVGIAMDDLVASLYALGVNHVLFRAVGVWTA